MSFLGGRLAATEGAFFAQSSKQAIARLQENTHLSKSLPDAPPSASPASLADVLPEILKHSLPLSPSDAHQYQPPPSFPPPPSSLAASITTSGPADTPPLSQSQLLELTGPLSYLPTLPQASFGSNRWKPPREEVNLLPSTANEASMIGRPTIDEARAKAIAEGYFAVLKAFLVGTALVMGGAAVAGGIVASRLDIHSLDDIRTKGQEHVRSQALAIQQNVEPWKLWVQERNKRNALSPPAEALGLKQLLKEKQ